MRRSGLFAEAVSVVPDGDDVTVVEQPVEDRRGHDGVAKDGPQFADGAVRGDEHGAALVVSGSYHT